MLDYQDTRSVQVSMYKTRSNGFHGGDTICCAYVLLMYEVCMSVGIKYFVYIKVMLCLHAYIQKTFLW